MLRVYAYQACSTCKNALKWLKEHQIPHTVLAIRETPPSLTELKAMQQAKGELRSLFNTSGLDYRAQNLKDKLPTLSTSDALQLLTTNGNLVKRPFAIAPQAAVFLTGFKEAEWAAALCKNQV